MNSAPQIATEFSIALSTLACRADAEHLALELVENHLAACVNLIDSIGSVYRWQGKVHSSSEVILLIKMRTADAVRLQQAIATFHTSGAATEPYDLPEFIVLPITTASAPYLDWLRQCLKS